MKGAWQFALAATVGLAACSADKPASSDSEPKNVEPASSPETVTPPVAAVVTPGSAGGSTVAGKASAPSKRAANPSPTTPPGSTATPVVAPAIAPVPVAARPIPEPAAKPATPAPAVAAVLSAPPPDPQQGKALYDDSCRKCHGVLGVPPKSMQAKFAKIKPFDEAFFAKRSDDSVVVALTKGTSDNMKSFKDKLTRPEMGAVAAYIRTLARP